jgi:hypothetical protein
LKNWGFWSARSPVFVDHVAGVDDEVEPAGEHLVAHLALAARAPVSPTTPKVKGAAGSSAWKVDGVPSAMPLASGTYAYAPPGTSPSTVMAHVFVLAAPAMTTVVPPLGPIRRLQFAPMSVFHTTVTERVPRSAR